MKSMEGVPAVSVPLRGGKKMKKRKELDALVAHTVTKRLSSQASGVSSHEQLLTDSSDEWTQASGTTRGRRRGVVRRRACAAVGRACSVLLIFTCAVATTTVMWLFIDVRQQVTSLRTELNKVVAAHQGVPDALQQCHSLSRELQKNQTVIMERLSGFYLMLGNFSSNMTDVRNSISAVQLQLKNSPSLVNDPRLVKDLSESVAKFGSKIQDLETTAASLKDQDSRLEATLTVLTTNVSNLQVQVAERAQATSGASSDDLAKQKSAILDVVREVADNVSKINDTLTKKLQWAVDDQAKDHKAVESLEEMNQNVTARLKTVEGMAYLKSTTAAAPANQPSSDSPLYAEKFVPTPIAKLYPAVQHDSESLSQSGPPINSSPKP